MVTGRIAADHEYQIGVMQVLELNGGGAAAGNAGERDAAGLVAIVAAVVDVVRAVEPREELQQEAGLVAAAAAEIPKRLVGRRGAELFGDAGERIDRKST